MRIAVIRSFLLTENYIFYSIKHSNEHLVFVALGKIYYPFDASYLSLRPFDQEDLKCK